MVCCDKAERTLICSERGEANKKVVSGKLYENLMTTLVNASYQVCGKSGREIDLFLETTEETTAVKRDGERKEEKKSEKNNIIYNESRRKRSPFRRSLEMFFLNLCQIRKYTP